MERGYLVIGERIKENAIPLGTVIDGVVKEVWADDDYETVEEWVEYTAEEYVEGRINELKRLLADTDYIAAKAMDALICCSNVVELLATLATLADEYSDKIEERKRWRKEINELEASEEV